MDFATHFTWQVAAVPVGTPITAYSEKGQPKKAAQWNCRYAFLGIGANTFGLCVNDALNTEGFSAGGLWLADSHYPDPNKAPAGASLISAVDIVAWAASNYASVAGLAKDLRAISQGKPTRDGAIIYFWNPFEKGSEQIPLHFQFHDAKGESLVLEFWKGTMQVTDNTDIGVMTNGPLIDWHRTNLQNYVGVTNMNTPRDRILGLKFDLDNDDNAFGDGTLPLSNSPGIVFPVRTHDHAIGFLPSVAAQMHRVRCGSICLQCVGQCHGHPFVERYSGYQRRQLYPVGGRP